MCTWPDVNEKGATTYTRTINQLVRLAQTLADHLDLNLSCSNQSLRLSCLNLRLPPLQLAPLQLAPLQLAPFQRK